VWWEGCHRKQRLAGGAAVYNISGPPIPAAANPCPFHFWNVSRTSFVQFSPVILASPPVDVEVGRRTSRYIVDEPGISGKSILQGDHPDVTASLVGAAGTA
jgi:hypothetical protein